MLGAGGLTIDAGLAAAIVAVGGAGFVTFLAWIARTLVRLGETQRETATVMAQAVRTQVDHTVRIRELEDERWRQRQPS